MILSKENALKYSKLATKMREKAAATIHGIDQNLDRDLISPSDDNFGLYSHYMLCNTLALGFSNLAIEDDFKRKASMRKACEEIAASVRASAIKFNVVEETRFNFGGLVYEDL